MACEGARSSSHGWTRPGPGWEELRQGRVVETWCEQSTFPAGLPRTRIPTPAPDGEPKTQSTTSSPQTAAASTGASPVPIALRPATGQPEGTATGQSSVASSLKPVLGSLVTGATRTTATPRPSASPHEASAPASAPRTGARPPRRECDPQRLAHKAPVPGGC